jgi:two-component system, LytTR family, sensor kinase
VKILQNRPGSDSLFKWLFHIIFWFYWIILPILNAYIDDDSERFERFKNLLPATLMCVPFFYLNSEYLLKRFIPRGQITQYILSLLVLFVVFVLSQYLVKFYFIKRDYSIRIYDTRTLFPVLFIISMSTVYGFIIFFSSQKERIKEEEEVRLKTELSLLRSQISPHFIFNVLNSIIYLIKKEPKNAEQVTLELSSLFRYMLYESEFKQVSIEKEIEYLKTYIRLQQIRFGDDVKIDLEIDQDLEESIQIEPMLLIPFVENAFKHGVSIVRDPEIKISLIQDQKGRLVFKVINKTTGLVDSAKKVTGSGIGLKNVKRRVELLYKDQHSLELKNSNGTFEAQLTLEAKRIN